MAYAPVSFERASCRYGANPGLHASLDIATAGEHDFFYSVGGIDMWAAPDSFFGSVGEGVDHQRQFAEIIRSHSIARMNERDQLAREGADSFSTATF